MWEKVLFFIPLIVVALIVGAWCLFDLTISKRGPRAVSVPDKVTATVDAAIGSTAAALEEKRKEIVEERKNEIRTNEELHREMDGARSIDDVNRILDKLR
jgi:hypothetical protein